MILSAAQMLLAASTAPAYLDDLPVAPLAVYSLRRLCRAATVALRVRRGSDNQELDVGFADDALDVAALQAFIGSASAFVVRLYDQTGNARDWRQTTATKQPRIANAGVVEDTWRCDGVDDALATTSVLPFAGRYAAIYTRMRLASLLGPAKIVMELSANYNSPKGPSWVMYTELDRLRVGFNNTHGYQIGSTISSLSRLSVLFDKNALAAADQIQLYLNGAFRARDVSDAVADSSNFVGNTVYGGGRAGTSLYAAPHVESLAFYAADTSAVRDSIEAVLG